MFCILNNSKTKEELIKEFYLTLLSLGMVIFFHSKFKFKLFLNDLWYAPETLRLLLTFTRDYYAEKKI